MSRQPDTADRQLAHIGGRRAPMPPGHVLSRKWPRLRRRPGWLGQASRGRRGSSPVPRYARSTTTSPVHQAAFIRASCGEEWPEARVCGCVFERYRLVISLRAHRQPASDLPIRRLLVLSERLGPSCSDRPVRSAARPRQRMSCRRPRGPGGVSWSSILSGLRVTGMPAWRSRSDREIEFSILPALSAGFGSA